MSEKQKALYNVEFMSCVIDKSEDMLVLQSDSHFCDFVGIHPSKIKQGKLSLYDLILPQDREDVTKTICKKNSPYIYLDFYIKGKKRSKALVHCAGVNIPDSTICHLTMADVTQSVERERELRAQAKEMNHLIDLVTGGVCLFKVNKDMHFEVLYANETCCRFFGTDKESIIAAPHRIDDLIHPDDKSRAFQCVGASMATKKPIDTELRVIIHRNEYMWCKMNAAIQRYDDDNCPIFHAMFSDITELKKTEQKAESQREMLVKVLKNVPGPLFVSDYDDPFRLNIVSGDFMRMTGYSRSELFDQYGGDLTRIMAPDDVQNARKIADFTKEKSAVNMTYTIILHNGESLTVHDSRKVITLDSGEKSMIGILHTCDE